MTILPLQVAFSLPFGMHAVENKATYERGVTRVIRPLSSYQVIYKDKKHDRRSAENSS